MSMRTVDLDEARALDREDPLASFRDRFFLPPGRDGRPAIYLAGNSLGLQPFTARTALESVLDDWSELAVRGWSAASPPWVQVDRPLARLAAPLLGSREQEVSIGGTLTGNLHALLTSFYRPTPAR